MVKFAYCNGSNFEGKGLYHQVCFQAAVSNFILQRIQI
jgi:hypothetical protein